jgi:hypothetical protein
MTCLRLSWRWGERQKGWGGGGFTGYLNTDNTQCSLSAIRVCIFENPVTFQSHDLHNRRKRPNCMESVKLW